MDSLIKRQLLLFFAVTLSIAIIFTFSSKSYAADESIGSVKTLKATSEKTKKRKAKIKISWSKVKKATKYKVYYSSRKNGKYSRLTKNAYIKQTKVVVKVKKNKIIYIKVRPYKGNIPGSMSTWVKVKAGSSKNAKAVTISGIPKKIGQGNSLKASAKVHKGLSKNVRWRASNSKLATVSSKGVITFKSPGTVKITAIAHNGVYKTRSVTIGEFNGGKGTTSSPYKVNNSLQLASMNKHLASNYVLTSDINLKNAEFKPIGAFVPKGSEGEDAETPIVEKAFSGTLDGANYTISNLKINQPKKVALGLFGCMAGNASVKNLNIHNVNVNGMSMVAAVVGYATQESVQQGVNVAGDNRISASAGMVGGISGGATNALVKNCTVIADMEISGNAENEQLLTGGGLIAGGAEGTNIENCKVKDSCIKVDTPNVMGLGAIAGCAHESDYVKNCFAENVTIQTGKKNLLVGGIVGFAGKKSGITEIVGCTTSNVKITADEGNKRIGGIVGGGFYVAPYAEYYPTPGTFAVKDCGASGDITGGEITGTIAGYLYGDSTIKNTTSTVTLNGMTSDQEAGGDGNSIPLSDL